MSEMTQNKNQTLKDKGFPYTKVKRVSHFICWLWSKLNNLGKSLSAFKSFKYCCSLFLLSG